MKSTLFEYKHYRDYLQTKFNTKGLSRGLRTRLAIATRTHPAFISKVLNGANDLSPEHIPPTNELLAHTEEESHFFTLLVLQARAGSPELKKYYQNQIQTILSQRNEFMGRVKVEERVKHEDLTVYYSKWYYIAIHILVSIPQFQTREAIAARLKLSLSTVSRAVETLLAIGVIQNKGNKLVIGKKRIHLNKKSPLISQIHTNIRNQALQKIADGAENDLHYSIGFSMSKRLFEEYRARLLDLITEFDQKFQEDTAEDYYCLGIDLFRG